MSTPTPVAAADKTASAAKSGGKGLVGSLKGHPPWVYAIVIVGAIGVAYMIRKRQNAAAAAAMASSPDDTSTPYGDYTVDTSAYPGASQGAYWGSGTPSEQPPEPRGWDPADLGDLLGVLLPYLTAGGGGPPTVPSDAHTVPQVNVPTAPVDSPAPAVQQPVYTPPPPPPPAVNPQGNSGPQPITGPNIFYNSDRKLRYVIRNTRGKNYRYYESRLNKGDWGQGGVIPQ